MAKKGKSPANISAIKRRTRIAVQTEMRWLMGRMLAQRLTRELPKGFACQYVKAIEADSTMSDALVISNSGGVVLARIRAVSLLNKQILLNMWEYRNASLGDVMITPAGRRLLKVLQQWAKEFELTSNLNEEAMAHMESIVARAEQAHREARRKARRSKTAK